MKIDLKKFTYISTALIFSMVLFLLPAAAATQDEYKPAEGFYGLDKTAEQATITTIGTNVTAETTLQAMIGQIINYIFGLMGVIFLIIVLVGGYQWMTAGGDEAKIGKAKGWIVGGVNGMIVMFLAYALVYVMLTALKGATGG